MSSSPDALTPAGPQSLRILKALEFGFALDRSASMDPIRSEVICGYNALFDEQRKLQASFRASVAQFGTSVGWLYHGLPIEQIPPLDAQTYVPEGATALLDGIGLLLASIGARFDSATQAHDRPSVFLAILTDGMENASSHYQLGEIAQEINYRRLEHDWQFLYLAAGEQAAAFGLKLSIPKSHIVNFLSAEVQPLLGKLSKALTRYRLGDRRYLLCL